MEANFHLISGINLFEISNFYQSHWFSLKWRIFINMIEFHQSDKISLNDEFSSWWLISNLMMNFCHGDEISLIWWTIGWWMSIIGTIFLFVENFIMIIFCIILLVQVWQLASKDADRSWVGFKDSKGKNKVILTILLEIMYWL